MAECSSVTDAGQRDPEEVFGQRSGAVFVGIRKSGPAGCFGDAEVHEFAEAATEPIADLVQGVGAAELAKEHGNKLGPAGAGLGGALGVVLLDQRGELIAGEVMEQLIEETGSL